MRSHGSEGARAQIEGLMAQIGVLRKRIAALYKKLMDTSDPALRQQLLKEIAETEQMVKLLEQRIAQLEQNAHQQAVARQHAQAAARQARREGG
jgi:chromosome segregation ATPase